MMGREELAQKAASLIGDLNLLLQRKEADRAFLMLLQDIFHSYTEISEILLSWNQRTITEHLRAGREAFENIMNRIEEQADPEKTAERAERQDLFSRLLDAVYAFGQTVEELERFLSMERKYFIILYGINPMTEDGLYCVDLKKAYIMAFAVKEKPAELTSHMGIPVIDIRELPGLEYDYLLCTEEPKEADQYPFEKVLNFHSHLGTFVTGGYELAYERMNFYRDRGPYDGIVTGLSYIRQCIDLNTISGHFLNFAIGGQDLFYSYQMFCHAYEHAREPERIRYAVIGVAPYIFQYDMSVAPYNASVAERYYSFVRRMNHFSGAWLYKGAYHYTKDRLDRIMKEDFEDLYTTTQEAFFLDYERKLQSMVYDSSALDEKGLAAERESIAREYHKDYPETVAFNIRVLREYLAYLKERQVKAILVMPPMTRLYRQYMSWEMYGDTMRILDELRAECDFTFVNFLMDLKLEDCYFRNSSHLNGAGAGKVTEILNRYLDAGGMHDHRKGGQNG